MIKVNLAVSIRF